MNISRFRISRDGSFAFKHLSDFSKMQPVRDQAATRNGTTPGSHATDVTILCHLATSIWSTMSPCPRSVFLTLGRYFGSE
jgi:hypothetical protein